jgi:hypothetical protein
LTSEKFAPEDDERKDARRIPFTGDRWRAAVSSSLARSGTRSGHRR